jgi:polyhydroxyalkanoate synthesis regulator phasin
MVMIEQLQQLAQCGLPWAEQRAQTALMMTEALQQGEISESEYQELMADLIRSDRLNAEADNQDVKNMLVSCIMIGAKLA